jgi:hypothetical protein
MKMYAARELITVDPRSMSPAQRATAHAEIDERYERQRKQALKKRGKPHPGLLRVCELEKIVQDRWPWPSRIPPTPDGRDAVAMMARHYAAIRDIGRFVGFVGARVNWLSAGEIDQLIERESGCAPCDADGAVPSAMW